MDFMFSSNASLIKVSIEGSTKTIIVSDNGHGYSNLSHQVDEIIIPKLGLSKEDIAIKAWTRFLSDIVLKRGELDQYYGDDILSDPNPISTASGTVMCLIFSNDSTFKSFDIQLRKTIFMIKLRSVINLNEAELRSGCDLKTRLSLVYNLDSSKICKQVTAEWELWTYLGWIQFDPIIDGNSHKWPVRIIKGQTPLFARQRSNIKSVSCSEITNIPLSASSYFKPIVASQKRGLLSQLMPIASKRRIVVNLESISSRKSFAIEEAKFSFFQSRTYLSSSDIASFQVIGQFAKCYILCKQGLFSNDSLSDKYSINSVWIIDQHAADERIKMESLIRDFQHGVGAFEPTVVTKRHLSTLLMPKEHFTFLHVIDSDENKHLIKVLPKIMHDDHAMPALPEDHSLLEEFFIDFIKYKACRRAIKAGDALTKEQMSCLIDSLSKCKDPFHCAHGRPTIQPLFKAIS